MCRRRLTCEQLVATSNWAVRGRLAPAHAGPLEYFVAAEQITTGDVLDDSGSASAPAVVRDVAGAVRRSVRSTFCTETATVMLVNMLTTAISIAALLLSAVTFGLAYRASKAADRRSRIPVLVFVYDISQGWLLRNVGNGPALNIEVAQKVVEGKHAGSWISPVRIPPLGRDKEASLSWLDHDNIHGLGAVYEDFLSADEGKGGRTYTVTCGRDRNVVVPGRRLPTWPESEVSAQWQADQGG